MFCTSKERETCNVEKMTCEGCYYNKDGDYMNEEEIIKNVEKYVELINKEYCDECNELNVISGKYCNGSRNVAMSIQGLLDLYNQEKEKNKKLEERVEEVEKWYEKLDVDFDMVRKENERLQLSNLFQEKVIDMMAEDISSSDLFTWDGSSELVKQCYFKKARGEEDVKD